MRSQFTLLLVKALFTLGFLPALQSSIDLKQTKMESVQVVIVGGGVAGLAAVKTLGSGVSYVLIEAQNYLGGRVNTIDAGIT